MHSVTLEAAHILIAAAEAERDQWRDAAAALAAAYLADVAPAPALTRAELLAYLTDVAGLRTLASGHALARLDALADAVIALLAAPPALDEAAYAAARAQALGRLNLEEEPPS